MKRNTAHLSLIDRIADKIRSIKDRREKPKQRSRILEKTGDRLEAWVKAGRHLEQHGSLDEIIEELDVTGEELSLYSKMVLKKKFRTWLKEIRLEEAKKLLLSRPDVPAYQIGFEVGITDKSNFRKEFKEYTGLTPKEWRDRAAGAKE
jgi:AraC-like DNA-binding protein